MTGAYVLNAIKLLTTNMEHLRIEALKSVRREFENIYMIVHELKNEGVDITVINDLLNERAKALNSETKHPDKHG